MSKFSRRLRILSYFLSNDAYTLYWPMRNSDKMTTGKTHSTLNSWIHSIFELKASLAVRTLKARWIRGSNLELYINLFEFLPWGLKLSNFNDPKPILDVHDIIFQVTEPQILNPNYGRVSSNLFHLPLSSASPQINSRLEEARNKDQLAVYWLVSYVRPKNWRKIQ